VWAERRLVLDLRGPKTRIVWAERRLVLDLQGPKTRIVWAERRLVLYLQGPKTRIVRAERRLNSFSKKDFCGLDGLPDAGYLNKMFFFRKIFGRPLDLNLGP